MVISLFIFSCNSAKHVDTVNYVDPQIGGVAPFLQPTRTRIHLPNSMVRMYPERKDYRDDQITSFPLTTRKHRSRSSHDVFCFSLGCFVGCNWRKFPTPR